MARFRPSNMGARQGLNSVLLAVTAVLCLASVPLLSRATGRGLSQWVSVAAEPSAEESLSETDFTASRQAAELAFADDEATAAEPWSSDGLPPDQTGESSTNGEPITGESTNRTSTSNRSTVGKSTNGEPSTSTSTSSGTTGRSATDGEPTSKSTDSTSTIATQDSSTVGPIESTAATTVEETPTTASPKTTSRSAPSTSASSAASKVTTTTTVSRDRSTPTTSSGHGGSLAALRNDNPLFSRYPSIPSRQLSLSALTEVAPRPDNGSVGDGQFRAACQYSHFNYDDPIVFPGQPGKSHLHMFFGNTETNANTTVDRLVNHGGGTCNGFELNRSAYWMPALLDGTGYVVVPEKIILYYKTKFPDRVQPLPQGLKMISGSASGSFQVSNQLFWSCGSNGHAYNKSDRIPDCGGDQINASIVFPECWDGVNLDSADHRSHLVMVDASRPCPASHPVRLPQISILVYFPGQSSIDGWHLSADGHHGMGPPGGSLHADWFGGWNDAAVRLWSDGCMVRARNCSFGQTGTDRQLASLNPLQNYPGPYRLPLSP